MLSFWYFDDFTCLARRQRLANKHYEGLLPCLPAFAEHVNCMGLLNSTYLDRGGARFGALYLVAFADLCRLLSI